MPKIRYLRATASLTAATALLAACSSGAGTKSSSPATSTATSSLSSPATTNPASQSPAIKITIAGGDYLGGAPVYVASAEGIWKADGIQANVANFATGVLALNALLGGQANFAFLADLPIATALLSKRSILVDANLSKFSQWKLIYSKSSGISSFASLKGKKIGVPVGSNAEYVLNEMLVSAGLTLQDVSVINLAPSEIVPAVDKGDIAAGVTFPTYYTAAQSILGGNYEDMVYSGYAEHTVLLAAPGTPLSTQERVLRALISADNYIQANPTAAATAIAGQSGGADSVSFVSSFLPQYAQKVALAPGLVDLLVAEGNWLNATQGVAGVLSQSTVLAATSKSALQSVDPAGVTLP